MRAMNLIPADERSGAGGAAGRSGGAAYVLLGALGVFVVLAALIALSGRSVDDKTADLTRIEAEATASEGRSAQYASFVQFAALRATRAQTVTSLAASRFDWSHAMQELARTVPDDVWLTTLQGTVAPGVALKGGGSGNSLRGAIPSPAVEMTGCTVDQDAVARMMVRMRQIDAVSRVALQSSVKNEAAAGGGGGGAGAGSDCRYGSGKYPQFNLVVFFDQAAGAVPTAATATPIATTGPTGSTGTTGAPSATATPTSFQEIK